jgi:hypothetical protein
LYAAKANINSKDYPKSLLTVLKNKVLHWIILKKAVKNKISINPG